jgi:hypothetical protein
MPRSASAWSSGPMATGWNDPVKGVRTERQKWIWEIRKPFGFSHPYASAQRD